ncbi:MAG TPA: lytic transglycosylase domain-containing protein [Puia sp.]|jgi:hypothetical protein|nr:lytic transglycosylase domain-containing protein [Puia sp.]
MLKSQVPFYFCSIAFFVGVPSAGNSGQPAAEAAAPMTGKTKVMPISGRTIPMPTSGKTIPMAKTGKTISMPMPGKQGMTFVSAYIRNNDDCLTSVKERSEAPFAIIDSVLNHYGLPLQLKYLAVIESELKASARSRVGARGPWQLMPATAHVLGLTVNRKSDERTNYYKSTVAAAEYLRDLHREFKDWLLVLAAYNGGPGPVYKAIHKSHSRNFWTLERYLPAESRQHVKKFIATAYYFEGPARAKTSTLPVQQTAAPVRTVVPVGSERRIAVQESADEKFNRLMRESAVSLKESKDLLVGKED